MEDHIELPDELPLPLAVAYGVLEDLDPLWVEYFKMGTSEEFTEYVTTMVGMPDASGDTMARMLDGLMDSPADELAELLNETLPDIAAPNGKPLAPHIAKIRVIELAMLDVACLFAVQVVKAEVDKASDKEQWELACEARRRLGMLQGYLCGVRQPSQITALAKRAADARHKENREMKREAFDWLSANFERFSSMDKAADGVREVVPIAWRTARDWVGLWNKMMKAEKKS